MARDSKRREMDPLYPEKMDGYYKILKEFIIKTSLIQIFLK